jgi:hypothetical protein
MTSPSLSRLALAGMVVVLVGIVPNAQLAEAGQEESIQELRARAEAGDAEAQNDLGVIYANGNVLPQNLVQAAAWYRKAAEQGDSRAQANLGLMYATGRGVPRNDVEAVAWYRKGAAQGHRVSKSFLDRMYEDRRGVSEDDAEFIEWLSAAEGQDNAGGEPVDDSVKAEFAILRVAVWDDGLAAGGTALIDLDAEIVVRHEQEQMTVGSWAIGRAVREERGASIRDFGPLEIGKKYVVLFTHARRDGSTVESSIELTPAFCVQGCDRDTLHVDVFSTSIELWGLPIHATGNKELEFRR